MTLRSVRATARLREPPPGEAVRARAASAALAELPQTPTERAGAGRETFAPRQFLFLQGPPGRFFHDLAGSLMRRGHQVHRINFNGGDLVAWSLPGGVNYQGLSGRWPAFLARLLIAREITDVVLFGDCRPMHRTARATAAGLGVAVHVFEEGYIRPDWITLEQGGVNGYSRMPEDPQWYLRAAARLDPIQARPALPEAFRTRAKATILYYAAAVLLGWCFPWAGTHRPWHPLVEAGGWLRRLGRLKAAGLGSAQQMARLGENPYFVLPLQLDSDYQLRAHSDFDGMHAALARVIASFARHAPADLRLVVKEHPLDNGLHDWRQATLEYARALGVQERVLYLEVGDIGLLVRASRGVATVNSTTGTLALAAGVPVFTLGRAIYAMAGLTHQGSLDSFWSRPELPDLDLYEAFRRVIVHRCLLHGGFYDAAGRTALVEAATDRILACMPVWEPSVDVSRAVDMLAPRDAADIAPRRRASGRRLDAAPVDDIVHPFTLP